MLGVGGALNTSVRPDQDTYKSKVALDGASATVEVMTLPSGVASPLQLIMLNLRGNSILSALDAPLSENLATVQSPSLVTAGGAIVSGLSEPLVEGEVCVVGYEITDFEAGAGLTYPANNGSAFDGDNPPVKLGWTFEIKVAKDTDTAAVIRKVGAPNITFGAFTVMRASWSVDLSGVAGGVNANDRISWIAKVGNVLHSGASYLPEPGKIYVQRSAIPGGNGAFGSPYKTLEEAKAVAQPGDEIILRPGLYDCTQWDVSGANGNPITLTTLAHEKHLPIIQGDLARHIAQNGTGAGVPGNQNDNIANRDGLYLKGVRYVEILNLTIANVWRAGIFIIGDEIDVEYGQIRIANCNISKVGASGITALGQSISRATPSSGAALAADDTAGSVSV